MEINYDIKDPQMITSDEQIEHLRKELIASGIYDILRDEIIKKVGGLMAVYRNEDLAYLLGIKSKATLYNWMLDPLIINVEKKAMVDILYAKNRYKINKRHNEVKEALKNE